MEKGIFDVQIAFSYMETDDLRSKTGLSSMDLSVFGRKWLNPEG